MTAVLLDIEAERAFVGSSYGREKRYCVRPSEKVDQITDGDFEKGFHFRPMTRYESGSKRPKISIVVGTGKVE